MPVARLEDVKKSCIGSMHCLLVYNYLCVCMFGMLGGGVAKRSVDIKLEFTEVPLF